MEKFIVDNNQNQIQSFTSAAQKRIGGIELLRYIFIMLIIWGHCVQSINFAIGVTGFFCLTGFFQVNKKETRFFKFLITTCIYTLLGILIYTIAYCTGLNSWNPLNFFTNFEFFRDDLTTWWFLYVMLLVLLVGPLMNKFLIKCNKWISLSSIIFGLILFGFFRTHIASMESSEIYHQLNFSIFFIGVFLYMISGWFRLYLYDKTKINNKPKPVTYYLCIFFIIVQILVTILFTIFENQIYDWANQNNVNFIVDTSSSLEICNVFAALSAITLFSYINIKNKKMLFFNGVFRMLGKISLPIYLFHGIVYEILMLWLSFIPSPLKWFLVLIFTSILVIPILLFVNFIEKHINVYITLKLKNKYC